MKKLFYTLVIIIVVVLLCYFIYINRGNIISNNNAEFTTEQFDRATLNASAESAESLISEEDMAKALQSLEAPGEGGGINN